MLGPGALISAATLCTRPSLREIAWLTRRSTPAMLNLADPA